MILYFFQFMNRAKDPPPPVRPSTKALTHTVDSKFNGLSN